MRKIKINMPLYMLSAANCVYALTTKSFNWLLYVSAALTIVVAVMDAIGVIESGREK